MFCPHPRVVVSPSAATLAGGSDNSDPPGKSVDAAALWKTLARTPVRGNAPRRSFEQSFVPPVTGVVRSVVQRLAGGTFKASQTARQTTLVSSPAASACSTV